MKEQQEYSLITLCKMRTFIVLHESWKEADAHNRVPVETLRESIETTEAEHRAIRAQYENRTGKYGMTNPSLDLCWWIE